MSPTRQQGGGLELRTLGIASLASLAAALIVSRFWINGTPIAAAVTPVIVAVVSELLNRPTEAIARRVTSERTALMPQATGAGSPAEHGEPERPTRVARDLEGGQPPVRVYRPEGRRRWGRIHPKIVALTAALAFLIAAAAFTLPELIAGQSLGKGDRRTTFWGGSDRDRGDEEPEPPAQTTQETAPEQEEAAPEEQQQTVPEEQPTTPSETTPETVPTVPAQPPEIP